MSHRLRVTSAVGLLLSLYDDHARRAVRGNRLRLAGLSCLERLRFLRRRLLCRVWRRCRRVESTLEARPHGFPRNRFPDNAPVKGLLWRHKWRRRLGWLLKPFHPEPREGGETACRQPCLVSRRRCWQRVGCCPPKKWATTPDLMTASPSMPIPPTRRIRAGREVSRFS